MNQALAVKQKSLNNAEQRAIDAAIACFSKQGIQGTNMEDVAAQGGMARSTLYRHFRDKDALIIKVIEQESLALAMKLVGKIKTQDFGEFLIEGVLLAVEQIPKHPVLAKMFEADALDTANRIMFTANSLSEVANEAIAPLLHQAQQEGKINKALKADMLMDWLVRIVVSLIAIPSKTTQSKKQRRALLEVMLLPALVSLE